MRTIWKFPLQICDEQVIEVPVGTVPLYIGLQADQRIGYCTTSQVVLWCTVMDTTAPKSCLKIRCFGTGNPTDESATRSNYIGTVQVGPFVWHFFLDNK